MPLAKLLKLLLSWSPSTSRRVIVTLDRALTGLLVLALGLPVWRFLARLPMRLSYPWELEWMEGGIVSHIRRVLAGEALYAQPSLSFTPYIYTPGYYYVSAAVSKVVGVGYLAPRLVSVLSILGCFALLFYWVKRETESSFAGWTAVGLFAATYDLSGRWFDIARADSLLLLLLLLACVCARFGTGRRALLATGAILAAAFFTKQNALSVVPAVLLGAALRNPQRGWMAGATFAVLFAVGVVAFDYQTRKWFSFYVFQLPAGHRVYWEAWREALVPPVWTWVAPMTLAGLAFVCGLPSVSGGLRAWPATALVVLCACAGSAAALLHTGGYPNVLIPAFAALAFASAIVLNRLREGAELIGLQRRLLAAALVLLQLGLLLFGASPARPRPGDAAAGAQLVEGLTRLPGPVWCPTSNEYPVLAGQPEPMTHAMAIVDVFKSKNEAVKAQLMAELKRTLSSGRIPTIVMDRVASFLPPPVTDLIHANYRVQSNLMAGLPPDALIPNAGAAIRPEEIWVYSPRGDVHRPAPRPR